MRGWIMTLIDGPNCSGKTKRFDNWDEAADWVSRNHPDLVAPRTWKSIEGESYRQFGTDYYYAAFEAL